MNSPCADATIPLNMKIIGFGSFLAIPWTLCFMYQPKETNTISKVNAIYFMEECLEH